MTKPGKDEVSRLGPDSGIAPVAPRRGGVVVGTLIFAAALALIGSFSLYSYLLFHTFAELFCVVIAATYATIAWHTRHLARDSAVGTLGIVYFFVAILDLFHTLSYEGMGVFVGYEYPANQVWVVARFIEASALCAFSVFPLKRRRLVYALFTVYGIITLAGLGAIYIFRVFPACFVEGIGQTGFKIASECVVMVLLIGAFGTLWMRRKDFVPGVYHALLLSVTLTFLSEAAFSLYVSNFGTLNLIGHILKVCSFYLVYRAVVVTCLERPQELIYERLVRGAEELRAANEAKDGFLSILSHDLRGPLSGIHGVAASFGEEDAGALPFTERQALAEIAAAADSSLQLLEGVLQWARFRNGAMEASPREFDVASLVQRELGGLREGALLKGVGIELELRDGAEALADETMTETVVRNLIHNAIKFTPAGGTVTISAARAGSRVVVSVADTGVGMAAASLERLFDANRRFTSRGTAGEKGSGFGLVLCAELAAKMGGTLEAESEEGAGSVFRLTLPAPPGATSPRG